MGSACHLHSRPNGGPSHLPVGCEAANALNIARARNRPKAVAHDARTGQAFDCTLTAAIKGHSCFHCEEDRPVQRSPEPCTEVVVRFRSWLHRLSACKIRNTGWMVRKPSTFQRCTFSEVLAIGHNLGQCVAHRHVAGTTRDCRKAGQLNKDGIQTFSFGQDTGSAFW